MCDQDMLNEISRQLDILIKLESYRIVEKKTLSESAPLLRRLGLTPSEIAAVFDSTINAVQVRIAEAKKRKKK